MKDNGTDADNLFRFDMANNVHVNNNGGSTNEKSSTVSVLFPYKDRFEYSSLNSDDIEEGLGGLNRGFRGEGEGLEVERGVGKGAEISSVLRDIGKEGDGRGGYEVIGERGSNDVEKAKTQPLSIRSNPIPLIPRDPHLSFKHSNTPSQISVSSPSSRTV